MKRFEPNKGKGKAKHIASLAPVAEPPPQQQTPVFCFHYLTGDYSLSKCDKEEKAALADTLHQLSRLTWGQIAGAPRKGAGYEIIARKAIKTGLPSHLSDDVNLLAFRFCANKPMVGYRERRIFHILFLDRDFTLYDHG
jgi:hypothetical protein